MTHTGIKYGLGRRFLQVNSSDAISFGVVRLCNRYSTNALQADHRFSPDRFCSTDNLGSLNRPDYLFYPSLLHSTLPLYVDAQGRLHSSHLGRSMDHLHADSHRESVYPDPFRLEPRAT